MITMKTLSSLVLTALLIQVLPGCARSTPDRVIPPEIEGVWVSSRAQMRGQALFSGEALYIRGDGRAAYVAGPPPVGIELVAAYGTDTGLVLEIVDPGVVEDGGELGVWRTFRYDKDQSALVGAGQTLERMAKSVDPGVAADLGL